MTTALLNTAILTIVIEITVVAAAVSVLREYGLGLWLSFVICSLTVIMIVAVAAVVLVASCLDLHAYEARNRNNIEWGVNLASQRDEITKEKGTE